MRILVYLFLSVLLANCNSSSSDKDTKKVISDTAKKDNGSSEQISTIFKGAEKIALSDLPSSIKVQGVATEAWKWNDNSGENILVLSQVAPHSNESKSKNEDEGETASLHAIQYIKKNDKYEYVWGLNEEEKACPVDISCAFIPGSTSISDLNKNGFAEIKVQYAMACRGDVSPATMKLVIRENGVDYGLMGNRWIAYDPKLKFDVNESNVNLEKTPKLKDEMAELERTMGRYESERRFANAPSEFLPYAKSEWLKYVKEKTGE